MPRWVFVLAGFLLCQVVFVAYLRGLYHRYRNERWLGEREQPLPHSKK